MLNKRVNVCFVSRHHFILEVNPPDARVRDLGSLNGTFVNAVKFGGRQPEETAEQARGRSYPEVDLKDGDRISVGNTIIQVEIETPVTCCQCGAEIPENDQRQAEWMAGSFMCAACRAHLPTCEPQAVVGRTGTAVEFVRCEQCGKDVTS